MSEGAGDGAGMRPSDNRNEEDDEAAKTAAAVGAALHGGMTASAGHGRHSHTLDKLVYMANQIAREFASQRPRDAIDATWDHLWHFWDPRMRGLVLGHLNAGGDGLSETAKAAVAKLRGDKEPPSQTKATEFNSAHGGDPDLMSDAVERNIADAQSPGSY